MADEVHIASLIVHVQPAHQTALCALLARHPALEKHAGDDAGKLIVVAETADRSGLLALIDLLEAQPGVLGCKLVYHEMVDANELDQELIPLMAEPSGS